MIEAVETKRKMKDSGIPWIAEIPEDWKVYKINQSFELISSGTTPPSDKMIYYENGEIPWVNTGDLNDGEITFCKNNVTRKAVEEFSTLKIYPKGSLLIALYGATIGKLGILGFDACTNQACCVLNDSKVIQNRFAFYWFIANKENIIRLAYGGGQPNISQEIIRQLKIPAPGLHDQNKIITQLDLKTAQLNALIKSKQDLITLLEQKRQSTINEAVTGALQKNLKRKSTGLPWLPEVPENWEIKKLKFLVDKIGSGVTPRGGSEIYLDEGIPLIRSQNVHFDGLRLDDVAFISEEIHNTMKSSWVQSHDVLLNITGASIGRCFYIEDEFETANVNQHVCIIRPNIKLHYKFLNYYLASDIGQRQVSIASDDGISREALNFEQIKNFLILLPSSLDEMKSISDYLDSYTQKVKQLISDIDSQIILLQQYRQSLISEVVTGKVAVKE